MDLIAKERELFSDCCYATFPVSDVSTQSGEGFIDTIRNIINKGKQVDKFVFGDTGTALRNVASAGLQAVGVGSKYATPSFPQERHAVLSDWDGKLVTASFAGPHTQIEKRVARGDRPVNQLDTYAKEHDIAYSKNKNNPKGIRKADLKLIDQIESDGRISSIEATIAKGAMKSKVGLEKIGFDPLGAEFSGSGIEKPPPPPARGLRNKMLKQYGLGGAKKTVKPKYTTVSPTALAVRDGKGLGAVIAKQVIQHVKKSKKPVTPHDVVKLSHAYLKKFIMPTS